MVTKTKLAALIALFVAAFGVQACTTASPQASAPTSSVAFSRQEPAAVYHRITPEQAKERIDSKDLVIILDVRTPAEFNQEHIPGAILVPNETIGETPPAQLPDFNAEILIYCRSGNRSRQAAEKLVKMGYTQTYDFGGIGSWPYETVKG